MISKNSNSNSNLLKHFIILALYSTSIWFIHMFIISIVSFIHFLLDHDLAVIEDWIIDQGWQIIIISKLLAIIPIYIFIELQNDRKNFIFHKLKSGLKLPSIDTVVIVFATFFLLVISKEISNSNTLTFDPFKFIISYLGTTIFLLSDFIIVKALNFALPITRKQYILESLLFPLMILLSTSFTFSYSININGHIYLNLAFILLLTKYARGTWGGSLAYILICISPAAPILGTDMLWGNSYSLFSLMTEYYVPALAVFYAIATMYSYLKTTKYLEMKSIT